jgi:hypothetical protein
MIIAILVLACTLCGCFSSETTTTPTNSVNTLEEFTVVVIDGNGSGTYEKGSTVELSPLNVDGKAFSCWKSGDTQISSNGYYSFAIYNDWIITGEYTDIITYYSVTSEDNSVEGIGQFEEDTTVTIEAKSYTYKTFLYWESNEEILTRDNPYTFDLTEDIEINPVYEIYTSGLIFTYLESSDSYMVGTHDISYEEYLLQGLTPNEMSGYTEGSYQRDMIIPQYYNDGINGLKEVTKIGCMALYSKSKIDSIKMSDAITEIGDYAIALSSEMVEIELSENLVSIGDNAFLACFGLLTINITPNVQEIGEYVFQNCTALINIEVDQDNQYYCDIDGVLFNKEVTNLIKYPNDKIGNDYEIPASVTRIEEKAFSQSFKELKDITFNSKTKITKIDAYAFYNCSNLDSVEVPTTITAVGEYAFYCCEALDFPIDSTYINLISLGDYAFYGCSMTSINLPESLTSIGESTFAICSDLYTINLPSSLTSIGKKAFYGCNMYSIIIPDFTEIIIEENAFDNCDNLNSVYINSEMISSNLFDENSYGGLLLNVTNIYIEESLTISEYVSNNFDYIEECSYVVTYKKYERIS